jgi:hypothetical protein
VFNDEVEVARDLCLLYVRVKQFYLLSACRFREPATDGAIFVVDNPGAIG